MLLKDHTKLLDLSGMKRLDVVPYYANLLIDNASEEEVARVNSLIVTRWSNSALLFIKEKAWKVYNQYVINEYRTPAPPSPPVSRTEMLREYAGGEVMVTGLAPNPAEAVWATLVGVDGETACIKPTYLNSDEPEFVHVRQVVVIPRENPSMKRRTEYLHEPKESTCVWFNTNWNIRNHGALGIVIEQLSGVECIHHYWGSNKYQFMIVVGKLFNVNATAILVKQTIDAYFNR